MPLRREGDNGGLAAEDASGVLCGERGAVGGSVEEVVDIALSFVEGADILLRVRRRDGDGEGGVDVELAVVEADVDGTGIV